MALWESASRQQKNNESYLGFFLIETIPIGAMVLLMDSITA